MARGGYGRGSGIPLQDRVRPDGTTAAQEHLAAQAAEAGDIAVRSATPSGPGPADPAGPCPAKHCWVSVPADGPTPRAALLVEWRKVGHLHEGRVAYVASLRPGRWSVVEEWVPAELLTPRTD